MGDRDADLASLRAELLGPEQRRLAALQARLDDRLARAEDLAEVLPTVLEQHAHDPYLARALTPPLEKAITTSVQRNPKPLADALFPIMGPAIRKAVSAGLAGMVESLNRTLEHSLSARSIRWRFEAWRTGKSFGEVVLAKTLLYRVEQIFLIDRRTGLLLQHVRSGPADVRDADLVSGMLTAIRDFVQDSFRVADSDSLEALKVGDLSVWIESGPHAIIAAVIRGSAPREYRQTLEDALGTVHLQFGQALETFEGDASAFDDARPALEACLETEFRASERSRSTRAAWAFLVLIAVALALWAGVSYQERRRHGRYLDALGAEPGLVVLSSERTRGALVVTGLRDPLARDPLALLDGTGLTASDVLGRWTAYYALDPAIVVTRAREVLRPPAGVELVLENGLLRTPGGAPLAWVTEAKRLAPLVAGVAGFDAAGALDGEIMATIGRIQAARVLFVKGAPEPTAGQDAMMGQVTDAVRALDALAGVAGRRFRVDIVGHTDADGPDEANMPLSRARAEALAAGFVSGGPLRHVTVVASGAGSAEPALSAQNDADKLQNRRVVFRVSASGGLP